MLSLRLKTACALIPFCEIFADIGCDHGMAVKFVLDNKLAKKALAVDISSPSLNKARELLRDYENVECIVSDGLKNVSYVPDVVLILGMGGKNILEIVGENKIKTLIISPQKNCDIVKTELINRGYKNINDLEITDKGKNYNILKYIYAN
ncbi:MAG: class I SAM-dependent methyltransferase [Firmicutes bacterium]|nr:class I SAM-dependent methyltransferase [Bacillota bacterium]MCL2255666.1 class I SAM-dependent methyltransferase [Bacillota bacterium]